jgi:hypothetical protein
MTQEQFVDGFRRYYNSLPYQAKGATYRAVCQALGISQPTFHNKLAGRRKWRKIEMDIVTHIVIVNKFPHQVVETDE